MKVKVFLTIAFVLVLTACGLPMTKEAQDTSPEIQFVKATVQQLTSGKHNDIRNVMRPELVTPEVDDTLKQMQEVFPVNQRPVSEEMLAFSWKTKSGEEGWRRTDIVMEYAYPNNKWIVVSMQLEGEAAPFMINGFHVDALDKPMSELTAFSLGGKGVAQYFFLVASIAAALTSIYAFVQCCRMPSFKRKWLWALFTLIGCCVFKINWSTGEVGFQLLSINFLSASVSKVGVGPWIVSWAIPIGAILFLRKRAGMLTTAHDVASTQENNSSIVDDGKKKEGL